MDLKTFIASGILENYCLGFSSEEENTEVEKMAAAYPEIKLEIEQICNIQESYIRNNGLQPSAAVKTSVMQAIYGQMAVENKEYAPLISNQNDIVSIAKWSVNIPLAEKLETADNITITELPSTDFVFNFIVYAKTGHDTEMHEDFTEYLYLLSGSCTMNFNGEEKSYREGDLIHVPIGIPHTARVTSDQPMIALVQRQQCA